MPELGMSVLVTRTLLGLPDLDINDHDKYYVGAQFMGGNLTWTRNQVTSPFVDGSVTTFRTRQVLNESVAIEVLGTSKTDVQANIIELVRAFSQDSFYMTITMSGAVYSYVCEAADVQMVWAGPRMIANQVQVVLSVPRQPVAQAGI